MHFYCPCLSSISNHRSTALPGYLLTLSCCSTPRRLQSHCKGGKALMTMLATTAHARRCCQPAVAASPHHAQPANCTRTTEEHEGEGAASTCSGKNTKRQRATALCEGERPSSAVDVSGVVVTHSRLALFGPSAGWSAAHRDHPVAPPLG